MREYFKNAYKEIKNVRALTGAALLGALSPVLDMFTITINQFLRISFTSLTHAMCGFLYGPMVAGFAATFVDILKYMIKPSGPFFIGFTINEFLAGAIFGFVFYRKEVTVKRVILARLLIVLGINLLLTPLWLSIMYGSAFKVMVSARIIKNLVMFPIDVALLYTVLKFTEKNILPKIKR